MQWGVVMIAANRRRRGFVSIWQQWNFKLTAMHIHVNILDVMVLQGCSRVTRQANTGYLKYPYWCEELDPPWSAQRGAKQTKHVFNQQNQNFKNDFNILSKVSVLYSDLMDHVIKEHKCSCVKEQSLLNVRPAWETWSYNISHAILFISFWQNAIFQATHSSGKQ